MVANLDIGTRWEPARPHENAAVAVSGLASVLGTGLTLPTGQGQLWPFPIDPEGSGASSSPQTCGESSTRVVSDSELANRAGLHRRDAKKLDRFSMLALAAARDALEASGLSSKQRRECGVIASTTVAGWSITEPQLRGLHRDGLYRISPYLASAWFPAAPQGQISIHLGLNGYSKSIAGDRTGVIQAAVIAGQQIRRGTVSHLLVGGVDAPVVPFVRAAYESEGGCPDDLYEASAFIMLGSAGSAPVSLERCVTSHYTSRKYLETVIDELVQQLRPSFHDVCARQGMPRSGDVAVVLDATPSRADELNTVIRTMTEKLDCRDPYVVLLPERLQGDSLGAGSALALHAAIDCLRSTRCIHAFVISIDRKSAACAYLAREENAGRFSDQID